MANHQSTAFWRFSALPLGGGTDQRRARPALARRIGRCLECQGWLECDAENSYLAGYALESGAMDSSCPACGGAAGIIT